MDHEAAGAKLTDYVRGALPMDEAQAVSAHLALCAECRKVERTVREAQGAIREFGEPLFAAHPPPGDMALFALAPERLPTASLAAVGAHLRTCPTCAREVVVAREASRTAWRRTVGAWLAGAAPRAFARLSPILALFVAALLYPGYLGLVEYPRERQRVESTAREATALRKREASLKREIEARDERLSRASQWSGASRALILSQPRRGRPERVPVLTPAANQPHVTLLIEYDPVRDGRSKRGAGGEPLEIRIVRDRDGRAAWSLESDPQTLWDDSNQALSVAVPVTALDPTRYRLEIRRPPSASAPSFTARFEVKPASG